MSILDFDNVIKTKVAFYRFNHYEKMFKVKKNGIDYDWADVENIIVIAKKDKKSNTEDMRLSLSEGNIQIGTGWMKWILNATKTSLAPGEYNCFEVILIFNGNKQRVWWDSGLIVKQRGYNG